MNTRTYRMSARADAVKETGDRILDATLSLFARLPVDRIRLDELASTAGVTVPTIVRRYGGKSGVIVALVQRELARLAARRTAHADDPLDDVIRDLVDHYERYGALILKVYSEAPLIDGLPDIAARARTYHVAWCRETFGRRISGEASLHARHLATAIAVCDATTWRILREDGGLDPAETREALLDLLRPIISG